MQRYILVPVTAEKVKLSIKDFFSKCDQTQRKLRIWSHLRKNFLNGKLILRSVSNIHDVVVFFLRK